MIPIFFVNLEYPSVPHRPPQFNASVPHKDHTFSAPKISHSSIKNLSVHHQNPSVPHGKPLSSIHPLVGNWVVCWTEGFLAWNWEVCETEKCVELRGFRYGTEVFLVWIEGFLVWNWVIFEAEKEWTFCVELMCWTEGTRKFVESISCRFQEADFENLGSETTLTIYKIFKPYVNL